MLRSRWIYLACFMLLLWVGLSLAPMAWAADTPATPASELFTVQCAGCHLHGGNIIRRGKNLKQRALKRNGADSVAAIADIITHGKGIMSAYGDRLTPEEIDLLATYVWDQAQTNWQ